MSTANIDISEKLINSGSKPIQSDIFANVPITRIGRSFILSRSHVCFIMETLFPLHCHGLTKYTRCKVSHFGNGQEFLTLSEAKELGDVSV